MASLETNKVLAAVLCAGLLAMATSKVAEGLRHPHELEENAFKIEVANAEPSGQAAAGPEPVEPIIPILASADPAAGENLSKKCTACHSLDDGGGNKVGPALWDIVGREKAAMDGFAYSDALAGFDDPKIWTYASLNKFMYKPKEYIPGTKMNYAGLKKVSDRADLIAYLRTLAGSPAPLPTDEEVQAAEAEYKAATGG
ncbi:MAG: cytochrome c family protein [Alphaproteobacteria bacterium]|nr:cytochrome c family protein [Alphaproteobacteria bacterium]